MGDKTGIQWTDATWNAVTGCDHVSAGCDHCYAETLSLRLQKMGAPKYADGFAVTLHEKALTLPLKWRDSKRIFVNSMSDQWHKDVPDEFTARMFGIMALTQRHTYQILTKRPQRAYNWLTGLAALESRAEAVARAAAHIGSMVWDARGDDPNNYLLIPGFKRGDEKNRRRWPGWPLPNVWIGTSVEDSRVAHRIDALRACPAAVRFLSCEPLIGPLPNLNLNGIHWVITGGESGTGHRPIDPEWVRDIRDQCVAAGVAFFHKQWGGLTPKSGGRLLDGVEWSEFPSVAMPVAQ